MKNTRLGLGKNLGSGYKNILSRDSYVHALSAKGVKQQYSLNMMDLATINRINKEQAGKAMSEGKEPFVVKDKTALKMPFPFPYIGDYVPDGWEKTNEYFVDSSGFGSEGESAMTIRQFMQKVRNGYGYAITSAGQFQVYVSEFKKKDDYLSVKKMKRGTPRYTNSKMGRAFFAGETEGKSLHIKIVDTPDETLLVGYGWAVYGARDKATGMTTYYEGWRGYSPTTSKQLTQMGMSDAHVISKDRREL